VKYGAATANAGYAGAGQTENTSTWTYDDAGNRVTAVNDGNSTTYAANAINQYTAAGSGASPGYSARGDLTALGHWDYIYDAFGNLIRAQNSESNALAKYWFDPSGHRTVKEVDGVKTVFFNWGTAQLEAYDTLNASAQSVIYEPGIDRPLAQVNSSGTVTFVHQDWLGSVVLLTDSSGANVQSFTYDAWGTPSGTDASGLSLQVSGFASRFLYTAREFDRETGLYHYRARAYSPRLGRFQQFDPIDFGGGQSSLLAYVANNPINLWDPYGLLAGGLGVGGNASVGLGPIGGAGYTGSAGLGLFSGSGLGAYGAHGGFAGSPFFDNGGNSTNFSLGAFLGGGFLGFLSNASCPKDLEKTEDTYELNVGLGPVQFSLGLSVGGGVWLFEASGGPMGVGFGASFFSTKTQTTGHQP